MQRAYGNATSSHMLRYRFRNGHRAMLPTGASDGNGDERLSSCAYPPRIPSMRLAYCSTNCARTILSQHVIRHGLVVPGEMTQLGDPVGVGKEANIGTLSASMGRPYLNPKDATVTRSSAGPSSAISQTDLAREVVHGSAWGVVRMSARSRRLTSCSRS